MRPRTRTRSWVLARAPLLPISRRHTTLERKSFIPIPTRPLMPKTALRRHSQHMNYSQTPKRRRLGTNMVRPLLMRVRDLTQAVAAQVPVTLSLERVDPSVVLGEQEVSAMRTSASKTCLVHLGELSGVGDHDSSLSRKRYWSGRISKSKRTSVSWMLPRVQLRRSTSHLWSNAKPAMALG